MRAVTTIAILFAFEGFAFSASAGPAKDKVSLRDRAQAVCFEDANRLCTDEVPDEEKTKACMMKKRDQLSAPCREVFDEGMK